MRSLLYYNNTHMQVDISYRYIVTGQVFANSYIDILPVIPRIVHPDITQCARFIGYYHHILCEYQ